MKDYYLYRKQATGVFSWELLPCSCKDSPEENASLVMSGIISPDMQYRIYTRTFGDVKTYYALDGRDTQGNVRYGLCESETMAFSLLQIQSADAACFNLQIQGRPLIQLRICTEGDASDFSFYVRNERIARIRYEPSFRPKDPYYEVDTVLTFSVANEYDSVKEILAAMFEICPRPE